MTTNPEKPSIADAILLVLCDERSRTANEIHEHLVINGISSALRSTRAALQALQFNLPGNKAPYRIERQATRPALWGLRPHQGKCPNRSYTGNSKTNCRHDEYVDAVIENMGDGRERSTGEIQEWLQAPSQGDAAKILSRMKMEFLEQRSSYRLKKRMASRVSYWTLVEK